VNDFCYMLCIIAVGAVVNFALRALPFVIFRKRAGMLPKWVVVVGEYASPIIIAGLIMYTYSGLAWKTAYPYIAGIVTVGLHVWKRNPLMSIIAGTVIYVCLLNCGCASTRQLELDAQHPAVRVSTDGVYFGEEKVQPQEVAEILDDYDVPHNRVIHIQLDPEVKDLRPARFLMGCLARAGYTRPVLVTKRHAESENLGKKKSNSGVVAPQSAPTAPKKIRYKKSTE